MIALMALSSTFVSCSDSDDDTDNAEQAKAIAGTYKGYSIGESKMFSDYLMGADASATIIANSDGTINLVYKSGSGDFILNNLKVSSKSFKGEGEVALAMGGNTPGSYEYTLEGSVSDAKVLTLKANVPVPMGGIDIEFIQAETPIAYYVASTYQYNTNLSISVMGSSYGSTENCKAIVKRASETTVNITLNGFGNLTGGGSNMSLGDFTINGVNVEKTTSGYTLSLGEFESEAESSTGTPTPITGVSLEGTVATDGTAEITVAFKPGSMLMPITAVFAGSSKSSAQ